MKMERLPLSVLVLTHNEEINLPGCLRSVAGLANQIVVVDSYSDDRTVTIAREFGAEVYQNRFAGFSAQRNWALGEVAFRYDWVLVLDADERVSARHVDALHELFGNPRLLNENAGFEMKRRFIWMGRWIRHGGYYPVWLLRLFRKSCAQCEERTVNEHYEVDGTVGRLEGDIDHVDERGLRYLVEKHVRYAALEARELVVSGRQREAVPLRALFASQSERKRWLRLHAWERLPPLVRPLCYFVFRYVLRAGFADGWQGMIYHVLQGLWFPFLIDCLYLEEKMGRTVRRAVAIPPAGEISRREPTTP
jgi:glycosyltransferase involved in cell wall biosynthesis